VNAPDDADEVTVVRPRQEVPPPPPVYRAPLTVPIAPPTVPASTFKPSRILIPAAVALLVVFGMFYIFSQKTSTPADANSNTNQSGLIADPNSQPVQAVSPPTGSSEAGIPSGGNLNTNQNTNANANANANASVTPAEVIPTPAENTNSNTNSNKQSPLPPPTRTVSPVDVPLPSPPPASTPRISPLPAKPSPTVAPK
jgi:hypothetical protein